jgi:hypothetical protein
MDKKAIEAAQTETSVKFDLLTKEKVDVTNRLTEIDQELLRLQGDYRTYANLLGTDQPEEDKALKESKPATDTSKK